MSQEDYFLNNKLRGIDNDLDHVNKNLKNLNSQLGSINSEIGSIHSKQDILDDRVDSLSDELQDYIETDTLNNEIQLAEARQGNLKQELHNRYGYYEEIRRTVLGILQAVDSGLVTHEILQNTVGSLMIKTPDYWLAPALVTLTAWLRDDREEAEKALKEAIRRDDYKTTLFFMLITRRIGRNNACHQWMERYLLHQDPYNLDREFITVLEAVSTGAFPPASRQLMMSTLEQWIEQLKQNGQYLNDQKTQWFNFFENDRFFSEEDYPLLKDYCTNWADFIAQMKKAGLHQALETHFKAIFNSTIDHTKTSQNQLDDLLSLLVTNFDGEELELKEQVRLNQLIIDKKGNKALATSSHTSERKIFDKTTNFLQMLTNAAFNPEMSGVSNATQTLAVAISRPWIIETYDSYNAEYRMKGIPAAELEINSYQTSITDGSDETEQLKKHEEYWNEDLKKKISKANYSCFGMGAGIAILAFSMILLNDKAYYAFAFVASIGSFIIYSIISETTRERAAIRKKNDAEKTSSQTILRGCIAELVDFRTAYTKEDEKAEKIRNMLQSVSAADFSANSRDTRPLL